jgi:hypothetical protein
MKRSCPWRESNHDSTVVSPQPIQNEPSRLCTSSGQYESLQSARDNTFCGSLFSARLGRPATLLAERCTSWKDKWEVEVPVKYCGCAWHLVSVSQSIRMSQGWARLTVIISATVTGEWKVVPICATTAHTGHSFFTSALDTGQWSASRPGHFTPRQRNPVPLEPKAGWATGLVWPVWGGLKCLNPTGIRTQGRQQVYSKTSDVRFDVGTEECGQKILVLRWELNPVSNPEAVTVVTEQFGLVVTSP